MVSNTNSEAVSIANHCETVSTVSGVVLSVERLLLYCRAVLTATLLIRECCEAVSTASVEILVAHLLVQVVLYGV